MTHEQAVYQFMKDNGSITSLQAIKAIGDTRLSATIYSLKRRLKSGERIKTEIVTVPTRSGRPTRVARYSVEVEQ